MRQRSLWKEKISRIKKNMLKPHFWFRTQ